MRINFDLSPLEQFSFNVLGNTYLMSDLRPLARKARAQTNISEFVYRLPDKTYIYLTIVGDEEQTSALGVGRGWYVAEVLSEESARFAIDALQKFTDHCIG